MAGVVESDEKNFSEIIIIGGGMGGLSAANILVKNGMTNFKILEARSKIGGRIDASETGNHKLELGANYIHGVLGNPMYEIASTHGLIDIIHIPKSHKVVAALEDGRQVPFPILQEIYEAYMCFLRRCEEYYLCHYLPPEGISSVGDHITLEAALYLDKVADPKEREIKQLIFDCLLKRETCITGCDDMREVDLLELGSYTELQGGNIVLPGGYSSILEPIAGVIPPGNVILDHPVAVINWKSGRGDTQGSGYDSGIDLLANGDNNNDSDSDKTVTGGTPTPRRCSESSRSSCERIPRDETFTGVSEKLSEIANGSVEVICENGSKFYANHVICTVPLGVLKEKAGTLFSPKLPQYKLDSINKLSFGTVNKIFLEYTRPFLNADVSEVMLLWKEDEADGGDMSSKWFKKIYSFSKVTETLILGWISGKEARYMETLPTNVIAEKCTEILRRFLNDPYIPMPKFCTCSRWYSQEFFRGSYTSIAVGASQLDIEQIAQPLYTHPQQKKIRWQWGNAHGRHVAFSRGYVDDLYLAEPCNRKHWIRTGDVYVLRQLGGYPQKPVLLFAGEHTHSSFYSTVHGAYLTGRNAAQILLSSQSEELELTCDDTNDLSSWIQGISLD